MCATAICSSQPGRLSAASSGGSARALVRLREALSRNSRVPSIRYHLAVALEEDGNVAEARRELNKALAMRGYFPERAEAMVRLERLSVR